uniref:Uncharacterized protein n=1 Tax=Arundo donax TaxID=35708 RepID=A0A0A9H9J4_ARUDO
MLAAVYCSSTAIGWAVCHSRNMDSSTSYNQLNSYEVEGSVTLQMS